MEGAPVKRERLIWVDGVPTVEVTTRRPLTHAAALETLEIIRAHPGTNPYRIAQMRGVTTRAGYQTVTYLERLGAVRRDPIAHADNTYHRACYLTEAE